MSRYAPPTYLNIYLFKMFSIYLKGMVIRVASMAFFDEWIDKIIMFRNISNIFQTWQNEVSPILGSTPRPRWHQHWHWGCFHGNLPLLRQVPLEQFANYWMRFQHSIPLVHFKFIRVIKSWKHLLRTIVEEIYIDLRCLEEAFYQWTAKLKKYAIFDGVNNIS